MGKNSRERHKAKRKAAGAAQRRRAAGTSGQDDPLGLFGVPRMPSPRQLAEQIIDQAVHAQHREETVELDRCRALLTAGPGGTAGIQVVNRALLAYLLREVEHAWRRGWQPTELVRVARREYTTRHGRLMVDAIAAQMRSYSTATVDPRWQSQLAAVDARVWWEHDDHYVTAWGERQDLNRAGVITALVEVLCLLATLPPIEQVGPMPGTAGPAASADAAQLLPVLAAREDAVRDAFEKQFPELTQHATAINNRAGWASGRAAADRASLHGRQAVAPG
jgi:hypothetical protein